MRLGTNCARLDSVHMLHICVQVVDTGLNRTQLALCATAETTKWLPCAGPQPVARSRAEASSRHTSTSYAWVTTPLQHLHNLHTATNDTACRLPDTHSRSTAYGITTHHPLLLHALAAWQPYLHTAMLMQDSTGRHCRKGVYNTLMRGTHTMHMGAMSTCDSRTHHHIAPADAPETMQHWHL